MFLSEYQIWRYWYFRGSDLAVTEQMSCAYAGDSCLVIRLIPEPAPSLNYILIASNLDGRWAIAYSSRSVADNRAGVKAGALRVLDRFPGFETHQAELARAATLQHFRGKYLDVSNAAEFSVGTNWVQGDKFRLTMVRCRTGMKVAYEPETVWRQYFRLDEAGTKFQVGNAAHHMRGAAVSAIIPADTAFATETFDDHKTLALRVEANALNAMLMSLLGEDPSHNVNLSCEAGSAACETGLMRQAVLQLVAELDFIGHALVPAALAAFEQALIVKFLYFNRHNLSDRLRSDPPALSSVQVRLIEAFIEARWDKLLSIEDIARELQISARSVFRHFKRFRGQSPFAFQKHLRLLHSRALLQTGDPESSVTSIALKCGFSSLGRFSRDYLQQFGELPSQTLRYAKRRTPPG